MNLYNPTGVDEAAIEVIDALLPKYPEYIQSCIERAGDELAERIVSDAQDHTSEDFRTAQAYMYEYAARGMDLEAEDARRD